VQKLFCSAFCKKVLYKCEANMKSSFRKLWTGYMKYTVGFYCKLFPVCVLMSVNYSLALLQHNTLSPVLILMQDGGV
jgi:hypothetical protein